MAYESSGVVLYTIRITPDSNFALAVLVRMAFLW